MHSVCCLIGMKRESMGGCRIVGRGIGYVRMRGRKKVGQGCVGVLLPFNTKCYCAIIMQEMSQDQDDSIFSQVEQFIDVLKQEKLAPMLLPFQAALFQLIKAETSQQKAKLKDYITKHPSDQSSNFEKNFKCFVYTTEIDRVTYLLKDYLKTRLKKIQLYCFHFIKNQVEAEKLLSKSELVFLNKYAELRFEHYRRNALRYLSKAFRDFRQLELYLGGEDKKQKVLYVKTNQSRIDIEEPNEKQYCFVKIVDNLEQLRYNQDIKLSNVRADLNDLILPGTILFCPYKQIANKMDSLHYRLI